MSSAVRPPPFVRTNGKTTRGKTTRGKTTRGKNTMGHDTTNGRTDRRTYLKALGAGTLATGMAGVAGCLGAEAETRNGSGGDSESPVDANEAQGGGAKTDTPTDVAQSTTADESSAGSSTEGGQSANGCPDASAVDTSGFETYTNSEDGYAIKYPADWEINDESDGGRLSATISGTISDIVSDTSTATLLVTIEPAGGKTTGEVMAAYLETLPYDEAETVKVLCRTEITLSSGQTGEFVKFEIDDGTPFLYNGVVFVVVANETIYRIDSEQTIGGNDETDQLYRAIIETFALGGGN